MNEIISNLHQVLQEAEGDDRSLKPDGTIITSVLRSIARQLYKEQVNTLPIQDLFDLCEDLLESGDWRQRVVAFQWAFQARKYYQTGDFARFERWLDQYVDSWGSCDDFCTHAFGDLIFKFPKHIPTLKTWTKSENRWFRRGAAVVMIYGIRREQGFNDAFQIADLLLLDEEDLVQKGYGWMLKEISNRDPQPVFEFVMQRKDRMPRTALRYAIEKFPPELRQKAMER
ncbi:DNA alkylation repair protein [Chloroflexota bacterium]